MSPNRAEAPQGKNNRSMINKLRTTDIERRMFEVSRVWCRVDLFHISRLTVGLTPLPPASYKHSLKDPQFLTHHPYRTSKFCER